MLLRRTRKQCVAITLLPKSIFISGHILLYSRSEDRGTEEFLYPTADLS
jgi:hypothetical protein